MILVSPYRAADVGKGRLGRTISLVALVAIVFLAFVLQFVPAPAARATVNNSIKITNMTLVKLQDANSEQTLPGHGLRLWEYARMTFDWDAKGLNPSLRSGDSFTVTLPEELSFQSATSAAPITLGPTDPTSYGDCVRENKILTCTFNQAVDEKIAQGFDLFAGQIKAVVQAVQITNNTQTDITVSGPPIPPTDLPGGNGITEWPADYYDYPATSKSVYDIEGTSDEIIWHTRIGTKKLAEAYAAKNMPKTFDGQTHHTLTFVDNLGPGQRFDKTKSTWYLEQYQSEGDANPIPEGQRKIADAAGYSRNGYSMSVVFDSETPTGSTATVTVSGPFLPNTNYQFFYTSKPVSDDGYVRQGFLYENRVRNQDLGIEESMSVSYTDQFSASITMQPGFGGFALTKTASGPGADTLAVATRFPVVVNWTLPGGAKVQDYAGWAPPAGAQPTQNAGQLTLSAELGKKTVFPGTFPKGTTITLEEDPTAVTPPAGYGWLPPAFKVGDDAGNSFNVGDNVITQVGLVNSLEVKQSVSVGDFVWFDSDKDGRQDVGEPGIENVTLTLTGPGGGAVTNVHNKKVDPVKTNGDGHYSFDDLPVLTAGQKYTVTVTPPAGYIPTEAEATQDRANDSSTGSAASQGLTANQERDDTLDFGFIKVAPAIDVEKYSDTLATGDADTADAAVVLNPAQPKTVTIDVTNTGNEDLSKLTFTDVTTDGPALENLSCTLDTHTINAVNGIVTFDQNLVLKAGKKYTCTATLSPIGWGKTHANSVTVGGTGVGSGTPVTDNDPWHAKTPEAKVSVGDLVWFDANKNGLQDDGEPGIGGAVLTLTDEDGNEITDVNGKKVAPFTTVDDGRYLFENLPVLPGGKKYKVAVSLDPARGYAPTKVTQGNEEKDSSAHEGHAIARVLADDEKDLTLDFGYIKPAVSVGDFVWFDANKDGKQDGGEPGIKDIVLRISRDDNGTVKNADGNDRPASALTATTDADGRYSFNDLQVLPDNVKYVVTVENVPAIYAPTLTAAESQAEGLDSTNDSSTEKATSGPLTKDGQNDPTLDFGFVYASVSVGDFVWFDTNKNGLQDDGEPGIEGVTLSISRSDDQKVYYIDDLGKANALPVQPILSAADGSYHFNNLPVLPAGTSYVVTVTKLPRGLAPTVEADDDDAA
ncbi:SdrD B-like domain-containing protein, partial [Schaalia canis]